MKIRWNDVEPPIQQDFDPKATFDNLIVTVKKINGGTLDVAQTSATVHSDGTANLEIWLK